MKHNHIFNSSQLCNKIFNYTFNLLQRKVTKYLIVYPVYSNER